MLALNRLTVVGESADGAFAMECSPWGTDGAVESKDGSEWALIRSLNKPMVVTYRGGRTPRLVKVLLNNFDYQLGDPDSGVAHMGRVGTPLAVEAGERTITFAWTPTHDEVGALLLSDVLTSSSLVQFTFAARSLLKNVD